MQSSVSYDFLYSVHWTQKHSSFTSKYVLAIVIERNTNPGHELIFRSRTIRSNTRNIRGLGGLAIKDAHWVRKQQQLVVLPLQMLMLGLTTKVPGVPYTMSLGKSLATAPHKPGNVLETADIMTPEPPGTWVTPFGGHRVNRRASSPTDSAPPHHIVVRVIV